MRPERLQPNPLLVVTTEPGFVRDGRHARYAKPADVALPALLDLDRARTIGAQLERAHEKACDPALARRGGRVIALLVARLEQLELRARVAALEPEP